jgi:hypothetical protein
LGDKVTRIDLLKHRGLTDEEIVYVLYGRDDCPAFNIFNPPRFGPDRCFLVFFPDLGTYFLGHGPNPIWSYVGDRGTNYAVLWTAQGDYKQLESLLGSSVVGMEMYGVEFKV